MSARASVSASVSASVIGPRVVVRAADFDLSTEIATLRAGNSAIGAVCSFIGTVRDRNVGSDVA